MVYPDRQRSPTGDGSSTNRGYSRRDIHGAGGAGLVALAGCTGGAGYETAFIEMPPMEIETK